MNWWLVKPEDRNDPGGQLAWLETELASLEKSGGYAYMIAHIPPDSCLHQFGLRYKALMERFQHIVRFSTFGHTHKEDYQVVRAINSTDNIGFNLITGSGTTKTGINPGFTVIEWDAEFMVPVNTFTYYMDMVESNKNPEQEPKWMLLHDALTEYGLKDLSPDSMSNLLDKFYNSKTMATQYEQNRYKRAESDKHIGTVNNRKYKCQKASESYEEMECNGTKPGFDFKNISLTMVFEALIPSWITI